MLCSNLNVVATQSLIMLLGTEVSERKIDKMTSNECITL